MKPTKISFRLKGGTPQVKLGKGDYFSEKELVEHILLFAAKRQIDKCFTAQMLLRVLRAYNEA